MLFIFVFVFSMELNGKMTTIGKVISLIRGPSYEQKRNRGGGDERE